MENLSTPSDVDKDHIWTEDYGEDPQSQQTNTSL